MLVTVHVEASYTRGVHEAYEGTLAFPDGCLPREGDIVEYKDYDWKCGGVLWRKDGSSGRVKPVVILI